MCHAEHEKTKAVLGFGRSPSFLCDSVYHPGFRMQGSTSWDQYCELISHSLLIVTYSIYCELWEELMDYLMMWARIIKVNLNLRINA